MSWLSDATGINIDVAGSDWGRVIGSPFKFIESAVGGVSEFFNNALSGKNIFDSLGTLTNELIGGVLASNPIAASTEIQKALAGSGNEWLIDIGKTFEGFEHMSGGSGLSGEESGALLQTAVRAAAVTGAVIAAPAVIGAVQGAAPGVTAAVSSVATPAAAAGAIIKGDYSGILGQLGVNIPEIPPEVAALAASLISSGGSKTPGTTAQGSTVASPGAQASVSAGGSGLEIVLIGGSILLAVMVLRKVL